MFYQFEKFIMEPVQEDDLAMLMEHRNDSSTWSGLSDVVPLTMEKQRAWYESLIKDSSRQYFIVFLKAGDIHHGVAVVIKKESQIGLIRIRDIDLINRSAQVGCDVFLPFRGAGYSHKIMAMINNYCFDTLNLHRLWMLVLVTNKAAIKAYEKAGFEHEGTQKQAIFRGGQYIDYLMYSKLREAG